jgi:TPR repeat protein
MGWKRINDDLEVRLEDGKPFLSSSQGLSLEDAAKVVAAWARTHEDGDVGSWLDVAEDEVDLAPRIESILFLYPLLGSEDVTPEEARTIAIRNREVERGEKALTGRDYPTALRHLRPPAVSGHPHAQFLLGLMYAKGVGVPRDNITAYVWLDRAAKGNATNAEKVRALVSERLSASELVKAQESALG